MFKQVKIPAEKASERPKGDTAFILLLRSTYSPPLHPRQNQSLLVFRGTPIVDSHRKFQKNSPSKNLLFHPAPFWCSVDFIWKSLISLFLLWINWNYNSSQELNIWFLFFLAPQYLQMYNNSNWYFFGAPWRDILFDFTPSCSRENSPWAVHCIVHRVHCDHLRLPFVPCAESLFRKVAIMMDMLMNSGRGHGHGPGNGHVVRDGAACVL